MHPLTLAQRDEVHWLRNRALTVGGLAFSKLVSRQELEHVFTNNWVRFLIIRRKVSQGPPLLKTRLIQVTISQGPHDESLVLMFCLTSSRILCVSVRNTSMPFIHVTVGLQAARCSSESGRPTRNLTSAGLGGGLDTVLLSCW